MALETIVSAFVAVGIGCRRGVAAAPVVVLVRQVLASAGVGSEGTALFTIDGKRDEVGLAQAAGQLGMPLNLLSRGELAAVKTPTRSERVQALFGVFSVAEAAALAGAGRGAVLLVPRVARDGVTCAVARTGP